MLRLLNIDKNIRKFHEKGWSWKNDKKNKDQRSCEEKFESSKAPTSGSLIVHRIHYLNDTRIINYIKKNKAMKEIVLWSNELWTKVLLKQRVIEFKAIKEQKGCDTESFNNEELKVYIQYKKRKSDPGMPKLTSKNQKNVLIIMANKYSGRLSTTIPNVDLNPLIEVKKENDLNINFENDFGFKKYLNGEDKELQML